MKNDIEQLRWRMNNGAPIEGDLAWCKRRLLALEEWPDELSRAQQIEMTTLKTWIEEYIA